MQIPEYLALCLQSPPDTVCSLLGKGTNGGSVCHPTPLAAGEVTHQGQEWVPSLCNYIGGKLFRSGSARWRLFLAAVIKS